MREAVKMNLCEILVANVFGLENPTFLAKSDIFIPKCTQGVGSASLGNIPLHEVLI